MTAGQVEPDGASVIVGVPSLAAMNGLATKDPNLIPATELAALIRQGRITALEALEGALERYTRFNSSVNAVILTRVAEAREHAMAADAALAAGRRWGPLHGVPMTIKEAFDWTGTPSTWGNPAWADHMAEVDAVSVSRLLGAGAVIWGKTNVPLLLAEWQTFNDIHGCTNNPWDLARTPGGSSGGAAAALATGMASLELGSDIGASIRNPAHYCGVFGHKPTYGAVPMEGHAAPGCQVGLDIAVCGPLARSAADLDMALDVLAGPHGSAADSYRLSLRPEHRDTLRAFRVAVMLDTPVIRNSTAMTDTLQRAVDALAAAGADITEAVPDIDQHEFHENYLMLLRSAMGALADDATWADARSRAHRYTDGAGDYQALLDYGTTLTHREWFSHHNKREGYRQAWATFFDEYDLLLCPVAASAAFEHKHSGTRATRTIDIDGHQELGVDQLFWAGWSCSVYLPATVAPAGLTSNEPSLPVGVQIVAPQFADRRSIRYAALIERTLGGFVSPPGYE